MPKGTAVLISAFAAMSLAGLAAAQPQPGAPAGAQTEQPQAAPAEGEIVFRHPLDDEVLELPDDDLTPAVEEFRRTGENPYTGDEQAAAEGRQIYNRLCAACHLQDGTGRIGPSLVDDNWRYEREQVDVGVFEVIHAGAAGAMQPFGNRLSQDEILQVMAYMDQLAQRQ